MSLKYCLSLLILLSGASTLSACGPSDKKPEEKPKTLGQATEELPEDGYHICRLNYRYKYSETEAIGAYIAVSGIHRDDLKKEVLNSCTKLPTEQSDVCGNPTVFERMGCVHVQALADSTGPEKEAAGKVFECSFKSKWYFADRAYKNYETFRMKTAEKKSTAIQALIEECMTLPPLERDGCTGALVRGQLRCVQKPADPA